MNHRLLMLAAVLAGFLTTAFIPAADLPDIPQPEHGRGYVPLTPERAKVLHDERFKAHGYRMAYLVKHATPPAEFDVKDMGYAGDTGDQAQCGSCYLCSTVKTATCAAVKAGLGKVDEFRLSWQYGMDCHDFGGCNGGNGTEVIDWMVKNGWPAEADPSQPPSALYPAYRAQSGQCRLPASSKKYVPKDWLFITSDQSDRPATVDEYKAALLAYGRVNISLDAGGQFSAYKSGVISSLGNSIDHEINVRGYSDSRQAILVENQWGQWGGAKAPGDDCAWVSYKAIGAIQSPFCVVFDAPQPPPVPPGPTPPPPGPIPPPSGTITLTPGSSFALPTSSGPVMVQVPAGLTAEQQAAIDAIHKAFPTKQQPPEEKPAPPPEKPSVKPMLPPEPEQSSMEWRRFSGGSLVSVGLWDRATNRQLGCYVFADNTYHVLQGATFGPPVDPPTTPPRCANDVPATDTAATVAVAYPLGYPWDHTHSYVWTVPGR